MNDSCEDATEIYLGTTSFSNIGASTDGQSHPECQWDGQTYDDIWYTFTAGADGTLVVSTCDLVDFDSDLVAYFGDDCESLTLLGCNDDGAGCSGYSSHLEVPVSLGDRITLRVGSYGPNTTPGSGSLLLNIIDSSGDSVPSPANDACADAAVLTEGDTYFTTVDATTDGPAHPSCAIEDDGGVTANDVWYRYTPIANGLLTISTCDQANYDTDLVIYDNNDCNALSFLACNDDGAGCTSWSSHLEVSVEGGVEHLIRVGGFDYGYDGTGIVTLSLETGSVWTGPEQGSWFDGDNWANGVVPSPTSNVTVLGSVSIDQEGATAASVTIQNGGHLQIGIGSTTVGSLDTTSITVQSGGTLQLQNSGSSLTATGSAGRLMSLEEHSAPFQMFRWDSSVVAHFWQISVSLMLLYLQSASLVRCMGQVGPTSTRSLIMGQFTRMVLTITRKCTETTSNHHQARSLQT